METQKYDGKDNHGRPKAEFLERLAKEDEPELFRSCKDYIWLSAYASNNPRSDYHWMCDACYDECAKRGKTDIYTSAHKYVSEG